MDEKRKGRFEKEGWKKLKNRRGWFGIEEIRIEEKKRSVSWESNKRGEIVLWIWRKVKKDNNVVRKKLRD